MSSKYMTVEQLFVCFLLEFLFHETTYTWFALSRPFASVSVCVKFFVIVANSARKPSCNLILFFRFGAGVNARLRALFMCNFSAHVTRVGSSRICTTSLTFHCENFVKIERENICNIQWAFSKNDCFLTKLSHRNVKGWRNIYLIPRVMSIIPGQFL